MHRHHTYHHSKNCLRKLDATSVASCYTELLQGTWSILKCQRTYQKNRLKNPFWDL